MEKQVGANQCMSKASKTNSIEKKLQIQETLKCFNELPVKKFISN